jgi:hypothetical protein
MVVHSSSEAPRLRLPEASAFERAAGTTSHPKQSATKVDHRLAVEVWLQKLVDPNACDPKTAATAAETQSVNRSEADLRTGGDVSMSHKFHIGQLVEFWPKRGAPISAARGAYEVLKHLPERDGELQYRIKNAAEEHARIVLEGELRAF